MPPSPPLWFFRSSRQEPKGNPRPRHRLRRGFVPDRPQSPEICTLEIPPPPLREQRGILTSAQDPDRHDTTQLSLPAEGAYRVDMRKCDLDHLPPEVVNPSS